MHAILGDLTKDKIKALQMSASDYFGLRRYIWKFNFLGTIYRLQESSNNYDILWTDLHTKGNFTIFVSINLWTSV